MFRSTNIFVLHPVHILGQHEFSIYSEDKSIASLEGEIILVNPQENFEGSFNLTGIFLGNMFGLQNEQF